MASGIFVNIGLGDGLSPGRHQAITWNQCWITTSQT